MRYLMLGISMVLAPVAAAQSTSGVFGPGVDEGESGWEYRGSYDPDSEDYAQRFHYQRAINGDLRWRLVGQTRTTDDSDFDPDHVTAELLWQVTPDKQKYQSGLRFDARYRFEDRPGKLTVHWINQWKQIEDWKLRLILGATGEVGDDAKDGVAFQTRASATRSLSEGPSLGVELFSSYGSTEKWLKLEDQKHQVGPVAVWDLGSDWSLYTGALFGATDASPDSTLRFRISHEY